MVTNAIRIALIALADVEAELNTEFDTFASEIAQVRHLSFEINKLDAVIKSKSGC